MSDREQNLIARARAGDRGALDELLRRHLPGLRAFVRLKAGPAIRARESESDLVQSVCREVLQQIGRFRDEDEASFRTWLFTTAMRKVRNRAAFWRREKRDADREEPIATDDGALAGAYLRLSSPSLHARGRELIERMERAFDLLPEAEREVILQVRILGQSHEEAAAELGRSAGACRVLLHRGLSRLAEFLHAAGDASGAGGAK